MRDRIHHGPKPLEDVINWQLVVRKYYQMNGKDDPSQDEDDKNDIISGVKHDKLFNMTEIVATAYSNHKHN